MKNKGDAQKGFEQNTKSRITQQQTVYLYYQDADFHKSGFYEAAVKGKAETLSFTKKTTAPDETAGKLLWSGPDSDVEVKAHQPMRHISAAIKTATANPKA